PPSGLAYFLHLDEAGEEIAPPRHARARLLGPAGRREDADVVEDVLLHDELAEGALDVAGRERVVRRRAGMAARDERLERRDDERRDDHLEVALAEEAALVDVILARLVERDRVEER